MDRIPKRSVRKHLRRFAGEFFGLSRVPAQRERQRRTTHAPRRPAIPDQRFGERGGFVEFGGNAGESPSQRCLRGAAVQFPCLTTLPKSSRIGRLSCETEVLLRPAGVPLDLLVGSRLVALEVGHLEKALMEPGAVELMRLGFRQHFPGLDEPIQTDVGALEVAIGRFDPRLQPNALQTFLDGLFELTHGLVHEAQLAVRSPEPGIAPCHQSIKVDGFGQFTRYLPVIARRDLNPLELGNAIDQGERLALIFVGTRRVSGIAVTD